MKLVIITDEVFSLAKFVENVKMYYAKELLTHKCHLYHVKIYNLE